MGDYEPPFNPCEAMRRLALVTTAVALAGCVSAHVFRTGRGVTYPPTRPDAILVFFSADDVKRPFEVIGEILAEGSSGWGVSDGTVVRKAQKKAASIGAHAIIVTREKGASAASAKLLGANDKKASAQAIRFTDPAADPPPPRVP